MNVLQTLSRVYVDDIEASLGLYERLLGQPCTLRFSYEEAGLELAQVGSLLILAGSAAALAPFRQTTMTLVVDSLDAFRSFMLERGASVVRDKKRVPTGWNCTLRVPDGTVIEFVEYEQEG